MHTKKSNKEITSRVVTYTPKKAAELLETKNEHNRAVSLRTVNRYAEIMRRDGWRADNGEAITISRSGNLLNGQHRLRAVVEAGRDVPIYTTFNVPDDSFETIDTGKRRGSADILSIHGEKHYTMLASALAWCAREEAGDLTATVSIENDEVAELLSRHGDIRDSVDFVRSTSSAYKLRGFFMPGAAAYLHYAFARVDQDAADSFINQLYSGDGAGITSPIGRLRARMFQDVTDKAKLRPLEKMALAIKAWNYVRAGKKRISVLRWSNGAQELFPRISGLQE